MYLYYAGGVIKLVHVEGGGGENYGGEGVTEDFEESYVADRDGEENFVDYLNSYESMVLRMDIPEITEQYLGIWVNGEYFTYDINQDSIDVADWVYLTK